MVEVLKQMVGRVGSSESDSEALGVTEGEQQVAEGPTVWSGLDQGEESAVEKPTPGGPTRGPPAGGLGKAPGADVQKAGFCGSVLCSTAFKWHMAELLP